MSREPNQYWMGRDDSLFSSSKRDRSKKIIQPSRAQRFHAAEKQLAKMLQALEDNK